MGNRLLLADDSITIQKVVAIIFANEEFELTVVDNGAAALEKAREIQPDVMLVDALMPGKTGYEVCAEIRRDPKLGPVPILLMVGAFEPLDEDKARDCGADASISKPFESQQLIDKVKELLEMGKTRKAAPAPAPAPAPSASPLPLEAAAEELWGDLSAFDTMAPVAPAAPQAPQSAAPPTAPQPAQTAPAAPSFAAPKATVAPAEEQIVEASSEDDLWGAFELEEETPAAAGTPAEVFGVVEPEAEFEAEEFFSFEEESEEIEETGPALELVEEPAVQPESEELFGFAEEAPAAAPAEQAIQLPEYEPFTLEPEPLAEAEEIEELAPAAAKPPAAFVGEEVPIMEPQAAPISRQGAPAATPAAGAPTLSEAQLRDALSKVSKEVIERIVWEVVPDLAEVLIKEEIKKLKAGIRG